MATIKLNTTTSNARITRAEAMDYVLAHLTDAPADVMDKLVSIRASFDRKPTTAAPSKTAQENALLAQAVAAYVESTWDETDPLTVNARAIVNAIPAITTTQKAVAVANVAIANGELVKFTHKGRTYYAPAGTVIE